MDFSPNKKPVEIIKKGAFGSTYFRDIYSGLMGNGTGNFGKNSISWKIFVRGIIVQIIMISVSINIVLNAEHR